MTFHIITIFPEIFNSYIDESILKRAHKEGKVEIKIYNLRDFSDDKHKTVDDTPYGGGPGMVLKVEPIYKCVEYIKKEIRKNIKDDSKFLISNSPNSPKKNPKLKTLNSSSLVILTSAKGEEYTQKKAEKLKKYSDIIIICGRYEGVDERVALHMVDEEISIGKYILTGGELPAMVILDSVTRLLPGVLGNKESLNDSRFHVKDSKFRSGYPVYTKPENFNGWKVPEVLLSGNHAEIEKWRSDKNKTK